MAFQLKTLKMTIHFSLDFPISNHYKSSVKESGILNSLSVVHTGRSHKTKELSCTGPIIISDFVLKSKSIFFSFEGQEGGGGGLHMTLIKN